MRELYFFNNKNNALKGSRKAGKFFAKPVKCLAVFACLPLAPSREHFNNRILYLTNLLPEHFNPSFNLLIKIGIQEAFYR